MIPSSIRVNLKSNVPKKRAVNLHVNQFSSISKRGVTTFNTGTDKGINSKPEEPNNLDQTNFHGKQASTPPSGHSYGTSDIKYSQYAGQDENKIYGYTASGSSTTNWTPGGGAPSSSTASPASGGQGTNWPSGQTGQTAGTAGTQQASKTKPGDPKEYSHPPPFGTGKGTDAKSTDSAWAQSEYASGKTDIPPKRAYEKEEDTIQDKLKKAQDIDPTKQKFSNEAQPEISQDTSIFSQTQSNKKESQKTGDYNAKGSFTSYAMPEVTTSGSTTSEAVKKGGVESQYDKRQFNNAFSDLQKKAPETADSVVDAARKAAQMMGGKEYTVPKDKGFYDIGDINKKEGETESRDTTLLRAGTGGKDATKMKGKEYENQVKGLELKDENYYAGTLKKGSEKLDSKQKDAYSQVDTTPKDYEHKVKGTGYYEMSDEDQKYNTSIDPSHAKDAREAVEDVANRAENMAKDTANWVGTKANAAKEKLGVKDSTWLGETVNTVEEKAKDSAKWVGDKAKDAYNTLEEKAKEVYTTAEEKAKDTYKTTEEKAKGAYKTAEEKAKDTYVSAENVSKNVMDDIAAGQRTVPGRTSREERTITADDSVKQDAGHTGINMQTVASFTQDIVNKVKETAETVKEKVGHIFSNENQSEKQDASRTEGQSAVQQNKRSSDFPTEWENDQNPPVNTGAKKPFGSNPNDRASS